MIDKITQRLRELGTHEEFITTVIEMALRFPVYQEFLILLVGNNNPNQCDYILDILNCEVNIYKERCQK